jgi:hypothetical protein
LNRRLVADEHRLMLFGMTDDFKQILATMASDYIGPAGAIPFE